MHREILSGWLGAVLEQYAKKVLAFDADTAQVQGRLRVANPEHASDKLIAATALTQKKAMVRTSMLSRFKAPAGVSGCSNAV
jgi:hypothetical protein